MSGSTTLHELAALVPGAVAIGDDRPVSDLVHDSRAVEQGGGFIAIRGAHVDGHEYVDRACNAGAAVVVVDHKVDVDCPQLVVPDTRRVMAQLAAAIHSYPANEMQMVGVTGTNGKTTVTHMIEAIVGAAGRQAGIVGTIGAHIAGRVVPVARTTPEATDLHRLLRQMVDSGVDVCALEVSSHALVYGRADAIMFDVAAFTNLSQDHLDFHQTMEDYFEAKARLFDADRAAHAVVWTDDPAGTRIASRTSIPVTTVGFDPASDLVGDIERLEAGRSVFTARVGDESVRIELPLAGRFNVANALVAVATTHRLGIDVRSIVSGLEALAPVPGRFEQVPNGLGVTVIVDYAHTPAAIESAIATAGEVGTGRVIAVAGSAGDRDAAKRRPMGAAAATADIAIITSDNPRSEDPATLVEEVLAGAGGRSERVLAEVDRRQAIRTAIEIAETGDLVLILGKGHEPYQEFASTTIDFDDRVVAAEVMRSVADERKGPS